MIERLLLTATYQAGYDDGRNARRYVPPVNADWYERAQYQWGYNKGVEDAQERYVHAALGVRHG